MEDYKEELRLIVEELDAATPSGMQNPSDWMKKAEDFVHLCLTDGNLSSQLTKLIPLREQGGFVRSLQLIKSASGSYNAGLEPGIRESIALIREAMRPEPGIAHPPAFTIGSLSDQAGSLNPTQKQLLDTAWIHFVQTGKPFPFRSVLPIIGRQRLDDLLSPLNESLTEVSHEGGRSLQITIYGALQSGHGPILALRFIALLELVNDLYAQDPYIALIDRAIVQNKLQLSNADSDILLALLKINLPFSLPFHLSSYSGDGSDWKLKITDEIIDLVQSESAQTYFDERLSTGFQKMQQWNKRSHVQSTVQASVSPSEPTSIAPTYISLTRIADLKSLKNKDFDCTRLICLCEELNSCASAGNANAAIMLVRTILDHISPVFGFDSFRQVAANYAGSGRSFKNSADRLDRHARLVADRFLHQTIRDKEIVPTMHEVNFGPEIESMIAEVYRILK